ncbi:D-alanyl-D-alanine carboxypeptidase family protein [Fusibacter sp. 3D3]|uniref:D-alanyl-D-alanine carboxypeptidase family protein n=1 Tax=Fusibacter sp. 3D3 TaxID=1048380 RepID=UPI000852C79B|nr:D-alanyl-D-alanine carboxypeptidase family protein [Fusibacter sp. 3D3]GAU77438.1 D-alanyl-D-alanine carboxypeptidase [Fusibacter sp. 3D3]
MIHFYLDTKFRTAIIMPFLVLYIVISAITFAEGENDYTLTASDLVAESAILMDQNTGQILFSKNENMPMYPASTTKILTAIIILEDLELTQEITITKDMEGVDGSGIALEAGEVLTVDELLHALLMVSANDAAEALAKTHSGTIEAFAKVMNERAASMGALNSNFQNPHGLPDPDHLTTSYDLAMIAKYAMQNETFKGIIMTPRYEIPANAVKPDIRFLNHTNKFIPGVPGSNEKIPYRNTNVTKGYELMTGIKSGYTTKALHCFVGAATLEGRSFISVIIKSQGNNMYIDTRKLIDYGLYGTITYQLYDLGEAVTTKTLEDKRETTIQLVTEGPLSVDLPSNISVADLTRQETIQDQITLPVEKGEILGRISYYLNDLLVCETNLVSADAYLGEDLITAETKAFDSPKNAFFTVKNIFSWTFKAFLALVLWRTLVTFNRLRQKRQNRILQRRQNRSI